MALFVQCIQHGPCFTLYTTWSCAYIVCNMTLSSVYTVHNMAMCLHCIQHNIVLTLYTTWPCPNHTAPVVAKATSCSKNSCFSQLHFSYNCIISDTATTLLQDGWHQADLLRPAGEGRACPPAAGLWRGQVYWWEGQWTQLRTHVFPLTSTIQHYWQARWLSWGCPTNSVVSNQLVW